MHVLYIPVHVHVYVYAFSQACTCMYINYCNWVHVYYFRHKNLRVLNVNNFRYATTCNTTVYSLITFCCFNFRTRGEYPEIKTMPQNIQKN